MLNLVLIENWLIQVHFPHVNPRSLTELVYMQLLKILLISKHIGTDKKELYLRLDAWQDHLRLSVVIVYFHCSLVI